MGKPEEVGRGETESTAAAPGSGVAAASGWVGTTLPAECGRGESRVAGARADCGRLSETESCGRLTETEEGGRPATTAEGGRLTDTEEGREGVLEAEPENDSAVEASEAVGEGEGMGEREGIQLVPFHPSSRLYAWSRLDTLSAADHMDAWEADEPGRDVRGDCEEGALGEREEPGRDDRAEYGVSRSGPTLTCSRPKERRRAGLTVDDSGRRALGGRVVAWWLGCCCEAFSSRNGRALFGLGEVLLLFAGRALFGLGVRVAAEKRKLSRSSTSSAERTHCGLIFGGSADGLLMGRVYSRGMLK